MTGQGHGVVIGASIAGLLMASVLSETFHSVTVYDRDSLPDKTEPRRGVPQGRQAHALHGRGADALTELLPGFWDEMVGAGGVTGDAQADVHWYLDGYLLKPARSGLTGMALTRPAIERLIRRRTAARPNISITATTDVTSLITKDGRVTGVRIRPSGRGKPEGDGAASATDEPVAADLVVDATGRGSRAAIWLSELGFPTPRTSQVRADVVYVTRHYRSSPAQLGGLVGALVTPYPGQPRAAAVFRQEGSQFVVLLAGMVAGRVTDGLPRRYFRAAGKLVAQAWSTSATGDLRFPETEGKRRPTDRVINAYLDRYRAAASVDASLGTAFLRVANMIDPPASLLSPRRVVRVFRSAGKAELSPVQRAVKV